MSTPQESSYSIFAYLQSQLPAASKLTVRPTDIVTSDGAVAHAIDGNGFPTLLIPVSRDTNTNMDWHNKSITFRYRNLMVKGVETLFLALECKSERLLTQFGHLVDDVLSSVAEHPEDANTVTRMVVDRWREMLKDTKQPLLSEAQLAGLYGELLFLEQLSFHHGAGCLAAWTGPQGNRHDFELSNASFEVKTTANHNNLIVAFHGVRQLEATNDLPLYVVAHQIERILGADSVPELLQRLYDSGIDRLELLRRLAEVGYHETEVGHYSAYTFSVLATKTVLVDSEFPRITHETLTYGRFLEKISSLQYSVDLGQLEETLVPLEDLEMTGE
ncbi:hypothetical protein CVV68_18590 [Arthrobacter livingstonensis]|uniref:PD-(D/E)XK motif protein n=1 Tax=Arthrobacter livingstonensis TaxID=670078 RepID=A0A2V5L580_9MICC|nr:PD-(D/E)XK motif protein [Arthrobacter livingstonensis]PYI65314.1 hypothetical protein CVV68_18590 [Arthrobacter livingstonensis]